MQYFDIPSKDPDRWERYFRRAVTVLLIVLLLVITIAGITAPTQASQPPDPASTSTPAQSAEQAHMVEQRITLSNGTTVSCVLFPEPFRGGSCDWARASRKDNG